MAKDKVVDGVEPIDAVTLLKADHRKVDGLFEEFDAARGSGKKADIVAQIVMELKIHTMIEEEIFYPALRGKIDDSIIDEGYVEHDGAKVLVNDLATGKPSDAFYDAKVSVLAEEIRHHVKEEERWITGMFAKARFAGVDMADLGSKMKARKDVLMAEAKRAGLPPAKMAAVGSTGPAAKAPATKAPAAKATPKAAPAKPVATKAPAKRAAPKKKAA